MSEYDSEPTDDATAAEDEAEPEEGEEEEEEIELLEMELEDSPHQAAEWLRELADELEAGGELTVSSEDESVTVALPSDELEFEVELEREPADEGDELELEIELEWLDPESVDAADA